MKLLNYKEYLNYKKSLNESFFDKDIPQVTNTVKNYLKRKTTGFVYSVQHKENFKQTYKGQEHTLYGIRFSTKTVILRLNWKSKNTETSNIASVDFWEGEDIQRNPTFKINTEGLNINQILTILVEFVEHGRVQPLELAISLSKSNKAINESEEEPEQPEKTKEEEIEETLEKYRGIISEDDLFALEIKLRSDNFVNMEEISDDDKKQFINSVLSKYNLLEYYLDYNKKLPIEDEPLVEDDGIQKIQKEMKERIEKQKGLTVSQKFTDYEFFIENLLRNYFQSIIVTGSPGVGKSQKIEEIFKKFNLEPEYDYVVKKGTVTPLGLYRLFYEFKDDMVIVFDDADTVFKKEESLNILKGCLDSKDVREISWVSPNTFNPVGKTEEQIQELVKKGKYPSKFEFTSRVIFVTNIDIEKFMSNEHLLAVLSRSYVIDITLSPEENIEKIEANLETWVTDLTIQERKLILNFFKEKVKDENFKDKITSRGFTNACKIYESFKSKDDVTVPKDDWKRLILSYL